MSTGNLLQLDGVGAGYGAIQVLWDLDLKVSAAEVCCVLGPNGAGKSTMAQVVAGTLSARSGRIVLDGVDVTNLKPEGRAWSGIAHVPQGRRVFAELTARENLEVARFAARDRASHDTEDFVDDLFPKLAQLSKMSAGRLSGGEQQMLAVARALMTEPRVLILDEPSLGLAPRLVSNLYKAIGRIRDRGVAIILVEQVVRSALGVSDTVIVLESGRVRASGPAADFNQDVITRAYLGGGYEGAGEQD